MPDRQSFLSKVCPVVLLLTLMVLFGPAAAAVPAQIQVNKANVRLAPDKNSRRLFTLRHRARVTVLEEQGEWLRIKAADGREGWLFRSLTRRLQSTLIEPTIEVVASPPPGPAQGRVLAAVSRRLARKLAAPEPLNLEFLVSRLEPAAAGGSDAAAVWLLFLRLPFSREDYLQRKGDDVNSGTIDLLPYQAYLDQLLRCRELLLVEMRGQPELWGAVAEVRVMLGLRNPGGDEMTIGGYREKGFPVFNAHLFFSVHGFSRFPLLAELPANVSDCNQFVLPPARLPDGARTVAALAYDFFGFPY